jgi:hypothetical protein
VRNFIDAISYKLLAQVNCVIETSIVDAAQKVGIMRFSEMQRQKEKIHQLFYHFANDQKTLRSISFNYWTAYYADIKSVFIGLISISVMFSYILFSGNYSRLLVSPIIIIGILTALHIHTGGQLARKILQLPKDQIEEILASHPSDLKVQIIRRFFS